MTRNEANESVVLPVLPALSPVVEAVVILLMSPGFVSADTNTSNVLSGGGDNDVEESCKAQMPMRVSGKLLARREQSKGNQPHHLF